MRLLAIIVEGHLYLAGIVAIFAAELAFLFWGLWSRRPLVGLVAVFVTVPLIRSTVSTIRACLFQIPAPEGVPLDRAAGRTLYALVEEIRRAVDSPPVDGITITGGFRAAATVHSGPWRFRRRRTLTLGLPVLTTLSVAELRAVIAHELAHFSSAHDRFSAWVYRTRGAWFAMRASLDRRLATPIYVYWLIGWYVRRLNAVSAEVSRAHEFVADQIAANVAGSRTAADALLVFEAASRFAEDTYWPAIWMSYETDAVPPRPYAGMLTWTARPASLDPLDALFECETGPDDTHPSLRERFARLNEEIKLPSLADRSAGVELLGEVMEQLTRVFDQEWAARHGDSWHQNRKELLDQRDELRRLMAIESPSVDELFKRAQLLETVEDADAALPIYQRAAEQGHAAASLAAGRLLLGRSDEKGIALVENAMARDDTLTPEACRTLVTYYQETRQELAARKCEWRAAQHAARAHMRRPQTAGAAKAT